MRSVISVSVKVFPPSVEMLTKFEEAFTKINPTSSKDMGLIMKEVSPKLKGKADMKIANKVLGSMLK